MPANPLKRADWDRCRKAIEQALKKGHRPPGKAGGTGGGALVVAAIALGLPHSTIHSRLRIAATNNWPLPNWKLWKKPAVKGVSIAQEEAELVRARRRADDTQRRLDQALKHIADLEDVRKGVFGLDPQSVKVPQWQLSPRSKQKHPEIPMLLTSDFQCGEVIRPEEIDFPNRYNGDVFVERYRSLVDTAIKLAELHDPQMRYPGFVYNRGGDAISGNIHADLAETQSLTCIEQVKLVATEEIRGLELLLDAFPQVTVYSVPGNHDRTTFKPRAKRYVDLSYDDLTLFTMEQYFKARGEKRITFSAPRSGDAYYAVFNTRFLLTHGDRMGSRGGQGFIGPAATIMRGIQKIRQQYARQGKAVDYVMHGHYHVAMDLPNGISNGSLAGFSEYAKNELRAEPELPSQSMWFVHPHWGITSRRRIQVDRQGKGFQ